MVPWQPYQSILPEGMIRAPIDFQKLAAAAGADEAIKAI
jgi:hypothetical protein